ncbi:SDR family oxidoreductase [Dehalococcoidia bacterium]|nr:SDR family oxidoreductase [Dehalococcoidia bacterium]
MRLKDKIALMSGVGPRMGRSTAYLFAQEGAKSVIVARREEHLQETVSTIKRANGDVFGAVGDVANTEDAKRVVQETLDRFGRIDILYSGGGGFYEPGRDFSDVDDEFWEKAVDNNLNGLFNLTKIVTPIMKSQGGGTILVISASFSVRQNGNTAYATAKAGLIGFAQSLSKELYSDNIRVNVVAPGLIRGAEPQTPVIPGPNLLNRVGIVQDIAYAAVYLVSDEASWVNGQVLAVDGGVDVNARSLENV